MKVDLQAGANGAQNDHQPYGGLKGLVEAARSNGEDQRVLCLFFC